MSGLLVLLAMSLLLGVGAFALGMIPLSIPFSKAFTGRLQILGAGLLLGTALGVIIPEGIETLALSHHSSEVPVSKISLSLLVGFTFMFLVEQFSSPHSHSHSPHPHHLRLVRESMDGRPSTDLEQAHSALQPIPEFPHSAASSPTRPDLGAGMRAYPFTLGLLIHGLADGLALGVSALSIESGTTPDMSLVVFVALFIHKAPTALALTTSLLSTTLSRSECRKHLLAFSASTPCGALVSYGLFSLLGAGDSDGDWTGVALLISGGTFLYVATVLQPVSHASGKETKAYSQTLLVVVGMFLPFAIGSIIGHGHHHGHIYDSSERTLFKL